MNFNRVILLGNITRDPQLSFLPSQTAVVDFGMAINRKWTSQDGQKREEVCFVDCRCFGKQAETLNKYVKKGNPLFIEGRLTLDQWEGKDGEKRSRLRVNIETFQFISPPKANTNGTAVNETQADEQIPPGNDDIPF